MRPQEQPIHYRSRRNFLPPPSLRIHRSFTERVVTSLAVKAVSVFAFDVDGDGDVDALSAGDENDCETFPPTTAAPTAVPATAAPTAAPTPIPSALPSAAPTTAAPTNPRPTFTLPPTTSPPTATFAPSAAPTVACPFGAVFATRVVVDLPPGEAPLYFLPGDINGDTDVDVGYSKLDADGVYVFALRSTCDAVSGCVDPEVEFASTSRDLGYASDLGNIVLENLDGDGDYDVVTSWGDSDGFGVTVLLDEGDDVWTAIPLKLGGARSVAAGDLNGDGDLDVVAGLPDDDSVYVFQQSRSGFYAGVGEQVVDAAATDVARVAAADVDGDADLDVVAASAAGLVWYENDGESIYGYYSYYSSNYYGSNDYGGRRLDHPRPQLHPPRRRRPPRPKRRRILRRSTATTTPRGTSATRRRSTATGSPAIPRAAARSSAPTTASRTRPAARAAAAPRRRRPRRASSRRPPSSRSRPWARSRSASGISSAPFCGPTAAPSARPRASSSSRRPTAPS